MTNGPPKAPPAGAATSFTESLAAARLGEAARIGQLLDDCRPYLLAIAQAELPSDLHGKLGASDLVQESISRGLEHFATFNGHTPEELAGWLRQILLNHHANVRKSFATEKRRVERECPADSGLADPLQFSPSREALSREEWDRLEAALAKLSDEQQQVIRLRHRENLSFAEIGERLQKSEDAAGKIWARAIEKLQRELQ
jgi:RNA polymerase sigma-70 factor (ECF subfamily)